jgi:hypothetical protein
MPAELSRALDRLEAALAACATDPPDLEAVSLVADAVEALLRVPCPGEIALPEGVEEADHQLRDDVRVSRHRAANAHAQGRQDQPIGADQHLEPAVAEP